MNQVAMIEGLLYNYDNEIPIFSKGIKNVMEAKELKKVPKAIDVKYTKLNFLSIRKMIRIFPDASLKAILEVLKIKDENIIPEYWIKETLARMAQIYPKKVKFVLNKEKYYDLYVEIDKLANKLDLDISGQEWDHDEIAKYFLLNDSCKHLELFFNWYEKIFKTYDFDTYFEEMAREILRVTKGE